MAATRKTTLAASASAPAPALAPAGTVAIVGTGVVGLSAALGCAQRGLAVLLIGPRTGTHLGAGVAPREAWARLSTSTSTSTSTSAAQSAPPSILSAAQGVHFQTPIYALAPTSLGLLQEQRIWPQVDAQRTCPVARMQIFGDAGGRLRLEARGAGVEHLATIVEESALLHALWLGCAMTPGIRHIDADFAGAEFGDEGASVRVRLAPHGAKHGAAHAATRGPANGAVHVAAAPVERDADVLSAALLLGADGRRSAVRAAAGINVRARDYGQTAVVANFQAEYPHAGTAFQWFTDEGVVALLPLPAGQVSLVWSAPHALAGELMSLAPEAFAQRLEQRTGKLLGTLAPAGERHAFALDGVVVDRIVAPGVALLGDAAHVVHPLAGQGLNLGLQDVSEFLRALDAREPWRALGDPVWLRRYERARAGPIGMMRGTIDGLARLFGESNSGVQRLRNLGLSAVDILAPVKNALVRAAQG